MRKIEVKEGVYWVGTIDWNLRYFHGYLTQKGTTYNAYLIMDEKITLVDTTKEWMTDEMLKRISAVVDPKEIDYIICNHVEMDHSGSLAIMMEKCPKAKIVTCEKGRAGIERHFKKNFPYHIVKTGDVLNIGSRNIEFALTPMVHWPDNMVAYLREDKILFSNDGLGQHIATIERFDDEYPVGTVIEEAKKYYANIVLPYGNQVQAELKIANGLEIDIVCPSHGIIWRKHVDKILAKYQEWAVNTTKKKVVIVYDTMWKSTSKMADTIAEEFDDKGYEVKKCFLQTEHISDIMPDIIDAEYICLGTPILNRFILPNMSAFVTYLRGLEPKGRKYFVFGSYGWSPKGIDDLADEISKLGEVKGVYKLNYIPEESELLSLQESIRALI